MKIEIIVSSEFEKEFKRLKKKYISLPQDLVLFEKELNENPDIGVNLGSNIRKIRLSVKSKNKGKSGGARIITFNIIANIIARKILLVTLYDKSEQQTISDAEIKRIIKNCNL